VPEVATIITTTISTLFSLNKKMKNYSLMLTLDLNPIVAKAKGSKVKAARGKP
jgi:hypothetical protein